ncbi:hypothetical protein CA948_04115 [Alcaligenes aquatilis]|nr:hypothetical protein CA948_04115 [Alcaligenes aquatilis]
MIAKPSQAKPSQAKPSQAKPSQAKPSAAEAGARLHKKSPPVENGRAFLWASKPGLMKQG